MTREAYLKQLILEDSGTVKDFAKKINMPYSTLHSSGEYFKSPFIRSITAFYEF